jgi:hypothetical protein
MEFTERIVMKLYESAGFEVFYVNCPCCDIIARKRERLSPLWTPYRVGRHRVSSAYWLSTTGVLGMRSFWYLRYAPRVCCWRVITLLKNTKDNQVVLVRHHSAYEPIITHLTSLIALINPVITDIPTQRQALPSTYASAWQGLLPIISRP